MDTLRVRVMVLFGFRLQFFPVGSKIHVYDIESFGERWPDRRCVRCVCGFPWRRSLFISGLDRRAFIMIAVDEI